MTTEEELKYRIKNRTQEELERAKKYDCNGICYGCRFMCPRAETCPETKDREFMASMVAMITVVGFPILIIIMIALLCLAIFN